jgi:hypothetical protein
MVTAKLFGGRCLVMLMLKLFGAWDAWMVMVKLFDGLDGWSCGRVIFILVHWAPRVTG